MSRRRVFRVAGAYAVVAWLVVQAAEIAFDAFEFPSWAMRLVILLCLLGLPVAVALAWAFDITPRGIERTGAEGAGAGEADEPEVLAAPVPARSPLRARLMVTAVVLAAIAAGALTVFRLREPDAAIGRGDPRTSLIVFPFENQTGSEELDYLEGASLNLLGLAVSHWTDMRVYDDERTNSLLRRRGIESASEIDFDSALEMAQEAEVGTFVLGELRFEGDSLALDAKIYDSASGERVGTEVSRAPRDQDPRVPFNSLAAGILHISGAPPGERPDLLAQTTESLEAYRAYLDGVRALQLFQVDGAKARLERAVAIDSTFALAYLRLRDVDGWSGLEEDPGRRRELVAQAVANSANLPPRYRLLVDYYQAFEAGRLRKARQIVEQMIERDSTDVEAWYQLGEAHMHDDPGRFPHPDTLGDHMSALNAFRRTLALDSSYVLAYQHILDVLETCAADNPWLCFPDSTVYAPQEELAARYGEETVRDLRSTAHEALLESGFAWVSAAPRSARARRALWRLLVIEGRLDEARDQVEVLRAQGLGGLASALEARIRQFEHDHGGAARLMTEGLDDPSVRDDRLSVGIDLVLGTLIGGARVQRAQEFIQRTVALMPFDTVSGSGLPKTLWEQFTILGIKAVVGAEGELLELAVPAWLDALDEHFEPGGSAHQLRWTNSGSTLLAAYLVTADTTTLARFLATVDTTGSRTWRTMRAHLALARGDVGEARSRLDVHFLNRDEVEIAGDPGGVRLFAWARLLQELGRPEEAAAAYEVFDTDATLNRWSALHVRSWFERGEIYRQLGERDRAMEMYERFIEAWADGDPVVQPLVADARAALETLRARPG